MYSKVKVLITGFEPFGNSAENSSWAVAEKFADSVIDGTEIVTALLPVSFSRVAKVIRKEVGKHNPHLLIMLGQSAGIDYVKLERVALNMMDSKGGDNDGRIPCEELIDANGMPAYFTNVPVKQLCVAVEQQGVAAKVSNSCGLYVCNRLYYEALAICKENSLMKALFVHLPLYSGQHGCDNRASMPLGDMVKAVKTIIKYYEDTNRESEEKTCKGF